MGLVIRAGGRHDASAIAVVAGFLASRSPDALSVSAFAGESTAAERGFFRLPGQWGRRPDARAADWK